MVGYEGTVVDNTKQFIEVAPKGKNESYFIHADSGDFFYTRAYTYLRCLANNSSIPLFFNNGSIEAHIKFVNLEGLLQGIFGNNSIPDEETLAQRWHLKKDEAVLLSLKATRSRTDRETGIRLENV